MVEKASDVIPDIEKLSDIDKGPCIIQGKDLETALASIQTLNGNNYEYGKEEVFHLLQESVESNVTEHIFEELLDALVESH